MTTTPPRYRTVREASLELGACETLIRRIARERDLGRRVSFAPTAARLLSPSDIEVIRAAVAANPRVGIGRS